MILLFSTILSSSIGLGFSKLKMAGNSSTVSSAWSSKQRGDSGWRPVRIKRSSLSHILSNLRLVRLISKEWLLSRSKMVSRLNWKLWELSTTIDKGQMLKKDMRIRMIKINSRISLEWLTRRTWSGLPGTGAPGITNKCTSQDVSWYLVTSIFLLEFCLRQNKFSMV